MEEDGYDFGKQLVQEIIFSTNRGNRVMLLELIVTSSMLIVCVKSLVLLTWGSVIGVPRYRGHMPYSWRQLTPTSGLISSCEIS